MVKAYIYNYKLFASCSKFIELDKHDQKNRSDNDFIHLLGFFFLATTKNIGWKILKIGISRHLIPFWQKNKAREWAMIFPLAVKDTIVKPEIPILMLTQEITELKAQLNKSSKTPTIRYHPTDPKRKP